ncbi:hypothetical protein [Dokdonia pacifica]|nr:hypothetical protein [Dokdonia pacifica]
MFNTLFLIFFLYLIIKVITVDNDEFKNITLFPQGKVNDTSLLLNLSNYDTLALDNFPFKVYLEKANLQESKDLNHDLINLQEITKNDFLSNNVFIKALTSELYPKIWSTNLDTINQIANWVDKLDFKDNSVKESIEIYWYNQITNHLSAEAKKQPNSKYGFKYRYLAQRCIQKKYFPNTGNSTFEKVLLNIIDQRWLYMLKRFWYSTPWICKIFILLIAASLSLLSFFGIKYLKSHNLKSLLKIKSND